MKKFWMISMLLIAALFVVSCGGDDEGGESGNEGCETQGIFRCNGNVSQTCDQGFWKDYEQCTEEKPCNTQGKCEAKNNNEGGNQGGNEGGNQGGNEGGNEGGNNGGNEGGNNGGNTGDSCADIFMCMNTCGDNDQACMQACYDNAGANAQQGYEDWYTCFSGACSGNQTAQCSVENCPSQSAACGITYAAPNEAYPAPYGTMQVNVDATYILTNETSLDQSMVTMSYFATGNLGNTGSLQPAGAQGAYYYAMTNGSAVGIVQTPFTNNGQTPLNPVVMMQFANISTGTVSVGLTQSDSVMIFIEETEGQNTTCYHGFAVGSLTISEVNLTAGAGGHIAITGANLEIYNSENAPIYGGNITADLNSPEYPWVACSPL